MKIGFIRHSQEDKVLEKRCDEPALIKFDSGRTITIEDGCTHVGVYGTTGSGKSQSVALPMALNLINAGCPGLILDIKRNLDSKVLGMLEASGRAGDYLEIGNLPSASPVDLIAGMTLTEFHEFAETAMDRVYSGQTHNKDFHMRGVRQAEDCLWLLRALHEKDARVRPGIGLVREMLVDLDRGSKVFKIFKKRYFDEANEEHKSRAGGIESDRFHALNQSEVCGGKADTTKSEQLSWGLGAIRHALNNILEIPGVEEKLFCGGAPALDMATAFREGKVVLLRMSLDSGPVGAFLARMLLSMTYKAVYEIGLTMGRKIFIISDEFQELADLSQARFSDRNFISQAREFNAIHIACTQSVSALGASDHMASVNNFISNQNQLILLYSNDPQTNELAQRYDPSKDLTKLAAGEAFVKTYNSISRRHEFKVESVNEAYAMGQAIQPVEPSVVAGPGEPMTLSGLLDALVEKKTAETNEQAKNLRYLPDEVRDMVMKKFGEMDKDTEMNLDGYAGELAEKFPDLMDIKRAEDIRVPVGWRNYLEKVLGLYRSFGMGGRIRSITINGSHFLALYNNGDRLGSVKALEKLLAQATGLCMRCGKQLPEDYDLPACRECMAELEVPLMKHPEGHRHGETDDLQDLYRY